MNKILIILGLSLLIIGLFLLCKHCNFLFSKYQVRKAKYEVPIRYHIGWWLHQNALYIDSFEVKIVESKLNLFNSQSLISYRIKGRLIFPNNNREPYIDEIHISERIVKPDSSKVKKFDLNKNTAPIGEVHFNPEAIIEITPIVKVRENKSYQAGQVIEFDFTNEHKIESMDWGNNDLQITCGQFTYPLVLQQRK